MWTYDLRIATRTLLRQPAFLALAVLTLGLGIGATAATFGAVRAVLLRPLPFPAPEQLVAVSTTSANAPATGADSSPPDVVDWAREQRSLSAMAAFTANALAISGPQAAAEQVPGATVTPTSPMSLGQAIQTQRKSLDGTTLATTAERDAATLISTTESSPTSTTSTTSTGSTTTTSKAKPKKTRDGR